MKKLRAGIRVKTSVLLAIWLMLVLLPFFCFKLAITSFFANHFQQNLLRIQPVLYTEMQNFCGDLDEKTLLRNKLAEFDQENGFKTFDFSINPDAVRNFENQNAKSIFEKLENRLKTPVSCVFYYGNDTHEG
ncbi:MAG: hypothetical protein PWR01_4474 [Clostridiales bacterium]|nr:hypothetical protein [Clostridiales bacterium]MDN5283401.1 hypothetical protein [Candidatus Ozemobacter sp.]